MFETGETVNKNLNLTPSIGLLIGDGKVLDVIPGSCAAAKAVLARRMDFVAVNKQTYSADDLKLAVAETRSGGKAST